MSNRNKIIIAFTVYGLAALINAVWLENSLIYYTVENFLLLCFFLHLFTHIPVKKFFADRSQNIQEHMAKAQSNFEKAKQNFETLQDKIKNAGTERKISLEKIDLQVRNEEKNLQKEAKNLSDNILSDAEKIAKQEKQKITNIMQTELADKAIEQAKILIQKKLTPENQKRLGREFIEKIKRESLS